MRRLELNSGHIPDSLVYRFLPRRGFEAHALARLETRFSQVGAEGGAEVKEGCGEDGGNRVGVAAGACGEGGR